MNDQNDRGQLWTISYPNAEVLRVTNDLTDYDSRADLTGDAKTLMAIANHPISNLWAAPAADLSLAQQINSAALPLFRVVEAQDGHLLATSMDGKLWSLRADGSQRTLSQTYWSPTFKGIRLRAGASLCLLPGEPRRNWFALPPMVPILSVWSKAT